MEINGKLTRRDFSKLCAGSTAALSLALLKLPDFDENTTSLNVNWQDLFTIIQSVKPTKKRLKRKPH